MKERGWQEEARMALLTTAVAALLAGHAAHVQSLIFGEGALTQPLAWEQTPVAGTFWSSHPDFPPLPWNPYRDFGLPVYDLGNGNYLVDDRVVDYESLAAERTGMVKSG